MVRSMNTSYSVLCTSYFVSDPPLLHPRQREGGEQIAQGRDGRVQPEALIPDESKEEEGNRVRERCNEQPSCPTDFPCLIGFDAFITFQDLYDFLLEILHNLVGATARLRFAPPWHLAIEE